MKSRNMKGKRSRKPLDERSTPYNPNKGFLRPKTKKDKKEETIRHGIRSLKILNSLGLSLPRLSTNHERLSQPVMKIGYWLHYFFYFSSCLTIVLGRIKFDCTLEDLHPVCQRKCFALEHSILSHLLWLARVAKSVLSRANLLPILW